MPLGTWSSLYIPFAELDQTEESGVLKFSVGNAKAQMSTDEAIAQAGTEETTLWDAP